MYLPALIYEDINNSPQGRSGAWSMVNGQWA